MLMMIFSSNTYIKICREAVIRLTIAASYASFLWYQALLLYILIYVNLEISKTAGFRLDDVFLTGVLAEKADLLVVDIQV